MQDEMPRERMQRLGAQALADYELLALLLRTGNKEHGVLEFARIILQHRGGLVGLLNSDREDLLAIKGLGNAKIAELMAVTEMARRYARAEIEQSQWTFSSPEDVRHFLMLHYKGLGEEHFGALLLDNQHRLLTFASLAQGGVGAVNVPLRDLVRQVLRRHAAAVILVHNHPAMTPEPSSSDKVMTKKIEDCLNALDVRVLDHIIVAGNHLTSMREHGGWE